MRGIIKAVYNNIVCIKRESNCTVAQLVKLFEIPVYSGIGCGFTRGQSGLLNLSEYMMISNRNPNVHSRIELVISHTHTHMCPSVAIPVGRTSHLINR